MAPRKILKSQDSGEFWFLWMIANVIGFLVGYFFAVQLGQLFPNPAYEPYSSPFIPIGQEILSFMLVGFSLSLSQWFVLRIWAARIAIWILISTMGWGFAAILAELSWYLLGSSFIYILILGCVVGSFQIFVLNWYFTRVRWWVAVWTLLVLVLSLMQGDWLPQYFNLPIGLVNGSLIGAATGFLMVSYLKQPYEGIVDVFQAQQEESDQ